MYPKPTESISWAKKDMHYCCFCSKTECLSCTCGLFEKNHQQDFSAICLLVGCSKEQYYSLVAGEASQFMHVSVRGDWNSGAAIHICGFIFLHHVASNHSFLILLFQNLQNECAHTQTTAQKLSSFLKSWSTLPSSEVREYNKSIKSTMGQLSGTQKSLQDKTSALKGLGQLFDQYNNVNADMKRY